MARRPHAEVGEAILQHRDLTPQGSDLPLVAGEAFVCGLPSIDRRRRAGDRYVRRAVAGLRG
jgi:hypothetical protein